jgi:hypothetical protein
VSNDATRAALATAMSTVDGVTGYARRALVPAPKPGDGWALWRGMQRADGAAFMQTWVVVIALAGDEIAADAWIESHIDDLYDALEPVIFIDSFAPAVTPLTGNSEALALMITGRSE